jgi:putative spermidine/putrescine transport system substrate-binding protein
MIRSREESMSRRSGYVGAVLGAAVAATAMMNGVTRAQPAPSESELILLTYGGSLEEFVRRDVAPAFEKKTGIKVRLVGGNALGHYAKIVATRNNPEADVYWSNDLTHLAGKNLGVYEKLDPNVVTNLRDVIPSLLDPDGIGVVSGVFATSIEYNKERFAQAGIPAPKSWFDLWDPRLKGKVALYTIDVAFSQDFLAIMSRLLGGNEKDIDPALAKIAELRKMGNLTHSPTSTAEMDNLLVQGQAWVAVNGSPRAALLQEKGAPIGLVFPREGGTFFPNYLEAIKNAPHPKAAQLFINYMLSVEAQQILAKGFVVMPANSKVSVPDGLQGKVPQGEDFERLVRLDRVTMNEKLDVWTERWDREVMGR